MKHFNTVIFDLDGTLLNTLTDLHLSVNKALAEGGFPARTESEVRSALGNGYHYLMEHCAPAGTEEHKIKEILAVFEDYYYRHSMDNTRPYDGIPETIDLLNAKGFKMAIVSNKGMKAVKELSRHFFGDSIGIAIGESEKVKKAYNFTEITRKQMKAYYKENKDLFTRYNNDRFFIFEVKTVIYKKIREAQYDEEINNILCKLA